MTIERQDILEDFYSGDTKNIEVTVTNQDGTLKDLSQSELTYALFTDDGKTQRVLFYKSSVQSEIEVTALGKCVVHLLPTDTFNVSGTLRHQLHVADENGYEGVVMSGKVQIFKAYARRPRKDSLTAYLSGAVS